jgi:hypothetical protein
MYLNGCNIEGCGTHGDLTTGGMDLTFNGAEGSLGLVMNGGDVEGNAGAWNFNLTNTGAGFIEHTFTGVNFNRVSTTAHVINNVRVANTGGGGSRVVFRPCTFETKGSYVANDTTRPRVNAGTNVTVVYDNCSYIAGTTRTAL